MSPRVWYTRGLGVSVVQVLWQCPLTDERYVTQRAWEGTSLDRCPFHPEGGCGIEKLGSYRRVEPAGARIPRWWCPKQRESISLLPSFLAARLTGTLADVERVIATVEAGIATHVLLTLGSFALTPIVFRKFGWGYGLYTLCVLAIPTEAARRT